MPTAETAESLLAGLAERVAEHHGSRDASHVNRLSELASSGAPGLQAELKALGYAKLGERARIISALKAATEAEPPEPAPPAPPAERSLIAHGAVEDVFDDGGLLKTAPGHV